MMRIVLCVGDSILAKGFERALRQAERFELLPTCRNVPGMVELIAKGTEPDLVLLDLTQEITFAVIGDLKAVLRNAKIVLWANSVSTELAFQAMSLGVRGILRKLLPAELQVECLERVHAGELWFEKALAGGPNQRSVTLTEREAELVSLLAQGFKNTEIAAALRVSEGTVKFYLAQLFEKAGVRDRFELALFGLQNLAAATATAQGGEGKRTAKHSVGALRSLLLKRSKPAEASAAYSQP